ncbi:hypothetical protein ACFLWX_04070 [Chloroflexota bacterium]
MESKEELLVELRQRTIRWIELDHRYKDLLLSVTGKTDDGKPVRIANTKWCRECDWASEEVIAAHAKVIETRKRIEKLDSEAMPT